MLSEVAGAFLYLELWYYLSMVSMKKIFQKDGTEYSVRFFDTKSASDLADLKEITTSKGVRKWMTDIYGVKHKHYKMWMEEQGKGNEFLFAVAGEQRVHGFDYERSRSSSATSSTYWMTPCGILEKFFAGVSEKQFGQCK